MLWESLWDYPIEITVSHVSLPSDGMLQEVRMNDVDKHSCCAQWGKKAGYKIKINIILILILTHMQVDKKII